MWKGTISLLSALGFALLLTLAAVTPTVLDAQDSGDADIQRQITDRFLQVLLRRPSPGTALDRVYGYHVQAGTLDQLMTDLKTEAQKGGDDAGARFMLLGLLQLQRGNDAEAAESLAKAEDRRGQDAMASYYLGKALLLVGRTDAAAQALERAIERRPSRTDALPVFTELGRLYQRSQQTDKALTVWQRLEETFPGDARVGEQIAQTLSEEGQDTAALERYEKLAMQSASSEDYRSVGYQIAAAELKRRMGRDDDAISDLEKILNRLRPSSWLYADVRRRIEAGFLRSGDYAALADYYAVQVEKKPDEIELRMRLGRSLAKAGRLNEAEAALTEAVKLAPENSDTRLALVDVLKSAGKADAAARQLETLVEQDSENPDYLIRLGNTWLDAKTLDKSKRRDAAAAAWQRLADAREDDAVVTAQVADLMRRIERTNDALKLYRHAIQLAPDQLQYREYLGEYLHKLNRKDEALETWSLMVDRSRRTRDNLIRLAEVLNTFSHGSKALEAFSEAAELDPTFSQRMRFAELLRRATRYDDSLSQLDLAQNMAETPEEREQLLQARIGIYSSSGKLDERIAEAREQAEANGRVENYRALALMLDAAARMTEATEAIESAMKADPADTGAMEVAAELYRKASRYGDAVEVYRSLARHDSRYLPNYLKRIASLQMTLGQVDQALATADELIAAQPGNPESYRFYADQCFRVGRDDEGIDKLRRALRAAPRNRDARDALASALSERFHTDEAIELYWQLLLDSGDLSDQINLVSSLASLYERKGNFDRLLNRIELRGREASDMRTAILLTAEAHRATSDLGSARNALQPLLVENPRDAELLQQMVVLSEAADEPDVALGYQHQLVALADTSENRNKLLTLMVDSGQIDTAEASLQRLQGLDDPTTIITMIDRTIRRKDYEGAIRFCRAALEKRSELWEIRVRLAALLLQAGEPEAAFQEADAVDAMQLADDVKSETAKAAEKKRGNIKRTVASPFSLPRPLSHVQSMSRLASFFRVGRYASSSYVSSQRYDIFVINDFGHAKVMTAAIRLAAAAKQGKLDEVAAAMADPAELETTDALETLQNGYIVAVVKSAFAPYTRSPAGVTSESQKAIDRLSWRMAELDPSARVYMVYRLMSTRSRLRLPSGTLDSSVKKIEPLSDERLDLVRAAYNASISTTTATTSSFSIEMYMANMLHDELTEAGREDEANEIRQRFALSIEDPLAAAKSLQFYIATRRIDEVTQLIEGIREQISSWEPQLNVAQHAGLSSAITAAMSLEGLSNETKLVAADLAIATLAIASKNQKTTRRGTAQSGTINTYMQINGQFQSTQIAVPFSQRLLPSSFAQQFFQAGQFAQDTTLGDQLIKHLEKDTTILRDNQTLVDTERTYRRTLAAFARWWKDDARGAYDAIVRASSDAPDNNDLWIERARLAAELDRPQASLEALDAINAVDQATLRVRELAAMNLAAQLGQLERAQTAARRLFGMRLDANTELALADQLTRLGMQDMATAILQRSRRRGGQSAREMLELANRYYSAGENAAAAEVAFSALRKLSRGTDSNESYYRRQAVEILRKAGRLDPLLKQAERRVASAPKSLTLKTELAELYTAAGRKGDADKVFDQIAAQQPNDPKTLWAIAERLYRAKKYAEAVDKYLAAIEKQPEMLRRQYSSFERAVTSAKQSDKAYQALMKMDIRRLDSYSLGRLVNMYRRESQELSESAEAFLAMVLQQAPVASLGDVLRNAASTSSTMKSEPVRRAVERIFAEDQLYQPSVAFWRTASWSSGGNLRGPLKPCFDTINQSDDLKNKVRQMLTKRCEAENPSQIAQVLLLVLEAQDGSPVDIEFKTNELLEGDNAETPYQLWWQIGQIFETAKGLENVAVTVLENVRDRPDTRQIGLDYEYGIGAKLSDVYIAAGQKEKARRELMRAYASTDNSQQNQYNPGYGDYQDLQNYEAIGAKLQKVDALLDAIRIYSEALSRPQRFEAAKRWGGSRDYKANFKKAMKETVESLTDEDFARFLVLDQPNETQDAEPKLEATNPKTPAAKDTSTAERGKPTFDLVAFSAQPNMLSERTSVAAMVVQGLGKSESGRQTLVEFGRQAAERLQDQPGELPLIAMRALVAVELGQDDAAEQINRLCEMVPKPDVDSDDDLPDADSVLSLYSPTLVALGSNQPAVVAAAGDLADRLIDVANHQERTAIALTLSIAKLETSGSQENPEQVSAMLSRMLDAVAPATDSPKVATTAVAQECVRIAELSAEKGSWVVAMEALRRGFEGGPPLRTLLSGTSARSAFVVPARQSVSSSSNVKENLDPLTSRIVAIVDRKNQDTDETSLSYSTLRRIVLPDSRVGEAFPYAVNIFEQPSTNSQEPELNPASLSRSLAVAAVACGQADQLHDLLTERRAQSNTPLLIDLIRVQLATAQADSTALGEALEALATTAGAARDQSNESGNKQRQAAQKSASTIPVTASTLLHAVLPLHGRDGLSRAVAEIDLHLLDLAGREEKTSNGTSLWSWVTTQLLQNELLGDDDAQRAVDRFLASVRLHYSRYSGNYGEEQTRTQAAGLARPAILSKRWTVAGKLLRLGAVSSRNFEPSSISLPSIALDLLNHNVDDQYRVLSHMVFGDGQQENDDLARMAMPVVYVEPPDALRSMTPVVEQARQISIGDPDFPITSASLMLADLAATCGQTDQLVDRLRPHVTQPGDEVEAMIGQALLADGRHDAAEEILDRVEKVLGKTKPKKNVKTAMPIESALFVARAVSVDSLQTRAKAALDHLLMHGRRRSIGPAMSFFSRLAFKQGMTHAAGSEEGSPQEGWISLQLPYYGAPICAMTEPRYVERDGTVLFGAGADQNIFMLKYPVVGEFFFSHRNVYHSWGESYNTYGGTAYVARNYNSTLTVRALIGRNTVKIPNKLVKTNADNLHTIEISGDTVRVKINGTEVTLDERTDSMPFVGIFFYGNVVAEIGDIRIEGNPTIPREVKLISPQLRGWSCPILGGRLLSAHLPLAPTDDPETVKQQRELESTEAKQRATWYVRNGELLTGDQIMATNPGSQRHIQYLRPLLDGESIAYEFFYEDGKQEVHPAIGRIAVLLRPAGVKLRWLPQTRSLESYQLEALHEVAPDEVIGDGRPELLEGEWNRVQLTAEGSQVVVKVNGKSICRFTTSLDQRFGVLAEKERSCRVRDMTLTGPWPETLQEVFSSQ